MAISSQHYIQINSTIGAGNVVNQRSLVARCFTANTLIAPNTFIQFTNATDVGEYFGTNSEEYYRAIFYFGWLSKSTTSAPFIQFARWVSVATPPRIFSIPASNPAQAQSIGAWNAITAGAFGITIGAEAYALSSLNFSTDVNLTEVAARIQTEIQAIGGASVQFTSATVTYDGSSGFNFVGGSAVGSSSISIQAASGQDISVIGLLGWRPGSVFTNSNYNTSTFKNNAIWTAGSLIQTLTASLDASQNESNNFGSFLFLNNLGLTISQIIEIATWNNAAAQNEFYLYSVPVIEANISAWHTALNTFGGLSLTLSASNLTLSGALTNASATVIGLSDAETLLQIGMPVTGASIPAGAVIVSIVSNNSITISKNATATLTETLTFATVQFPEMAPMMIEATTDYSLPNAVQNYMFQIFEGLSPLVFDESDATAYDALALNYYGQTQSAGQKFNFYQRGLMQGGATDARDQNVYVNEIWLKDAITAAFLQLLLNVTELPANAQGKALSLLTIQGVINQSLINGVISVGKTLTAAQKAFITFTTNDPNAWYQVQNTGYWINAEIQVIPASDPIEYEVVYTLIYSKNDVIRFVSGTNILI